MPRSNWKGVISFGLVNIPIILYNSVDPASTISFKQINKKTGATIKYKRIDSETGDEVPWSEIGKGYPYSKDIVLPIEEGELHRVAGENARTIAIEEFVDKKNINFLNIEHAYYLAPDKKGEKGYVILREALNGTNKVGIAKVIISTKEYLAAVTTFENALVLYLLHYQNEIRKLSDFNLPSEDLKKYKVSHAEVEIAKKLINSMSGKWKPEKYQDEFKQAVATWVHEKVNHLPETKMQPRATKPKGAVVDFVALMKKSLASKKLGEKMPKSTKKAKLNLPKTAGLRKRAPARVRH